MKRVLIFSLAYYPRVGGAEVAIKEITDRIKDLEFEMVTLRFGNESRQERVGNVLVHRVGWGGGYISKMLFIPAAMAEAYVLHRERNFDAAWAMMSYMVLPLVLLRMLGVRMPYVLNLQEGDPFRHMFSRLHILPFRFLLSYGFKQASIIQTLSTYLAGWARRMGYKGEIVVIPNAADTKRFASAEPIDFGRKPDEVWLVTSSRLVYKNAVDDVIRALALLPAHIKFLVLGDGKEERALKKLAQDLGVAERVLFKGYVSHQELPGYLRASDIFIRVSRSEGFGASFVEAMAAGLPVIATQEGGLADFLFDAKRNPDKQTTGWAVEKNSPTQIAEVVGEIVGNPEGTKRVVENARQMVLHKYDWDLIAQDMRTKVFSKIV